jgi:hypothetical protein
MAEDENIINIVSRLEKKIEATGKGSLPPGGGDGIYGGMEQRVIRLEEDVKAIRSDLQIVKDRVGHLPTASQVAGGLLGFMVVMAAIVLATGSYMSGTMSTALTAIQTVLAAKPSPSAPAQPSIIVVPLSPATLTPQPQQKSP